jgi:hypothetical protein
LAYTVDDLDGPISAMGQPSGDTPIQRDDLAVADDLA